jgi:hypothetical protein
MGPFRPNSNDLYKNIINDQGKTIAKGDLIPNSGRKLSELEWQTGMAVAVVMLQRAKNVV